MKNIDFSYETDANDSFLVATLPSGANLIQNQVKMLLHNSDIPHILEMRLYHEDETARLRYTVTAKITLEQALLRRQMNRSEFVALLLDLLECFRELPDYQLTPCGLCLDEKHIFVESGNFHPYFVYLPIYREDSDLGYLRKFVQDMIVNCRVVSQNDDFTQRMLTLFNEQDLTVDRIQQQLRKLERPTDPDSGLSKKQPFPLNPPKKQASVLRERTLPRRTCQFRLSRRLHRWKSLTNRLKQASRLLQIQGQQASRQNPSPLKMGAVALSFWRCRAFGLCCWLSRSNAAFSFRMGRGMFPTSRVSQCLRLSLIMSCTGNSCKTKAAERLPRRPGRNVPAEKARPQRIRASDAPRRRKKRAICVTAIIVPVNRSIRSNPIPPRHQFRRRLNLRFQLRRLLS